MPRHRPTVPGARVCGIVLISVAAAVVGGCGGGPSVRSEVAPPPPDDLFVDWDHHDWLLDRFVLASARGFEAMQATSTAQPWEVYREAVTYSAPWDSLSLVAFISLDPDEQRLRRQDAAAALRRGRRAVLETINWYRRRVDDGLEPTLPADPRSTVTRALREFVNATGIDPSHPGAWRDLAYFCGAAGDRTRQQGALASSLAALDQLPGEISESVDAKRLRRDVLLDLAWLARDLGQPAVTVAYLAYLEPWLTVRCRERTERVYEAQLLRGLAFADQGEWLAAVTQARDLPRIDVTTRTLPGGSAREGLRFTITAPHFFTLGFDRAAWPKQLSDFGRRWIKALAGAPTISNAHALWLLGPPPTHLEFPSRLASRFWQDQGRLYARAGRYETARDCYEWAARYRPYAAFFPLGGNDGRRRNGGQGYFVGYGRFFLCGDRAAYDRDLAHQLAQRTRANGDDRD